MIKVILMQRKKPTIRNWECQWRDPATGKLCTRSTGTKKRRDAERIAGRIEAEINEGRYVQSLKNGWQLVADRYEAEMLAGKSRGTRQKWLSTRCKVETYLSPDKAAAVTSERISELTHRLRLEELSEPTIKSHLSHLQAMLRWAARHGLIPAAPHVEKPTRTATSKGRPVTDAEFKRMLSVIPAIVGNENEKGWKFLLEFLWASGLRLGEALQATWGSGKFAVIINGDRPRLVIAALADKSGKPRELPLAPEVADLLATVPEKRRVGRLVSVDLLYSRDLRRLDTISKTISRIGKEAGIVVSSDPDDDTAKYASAHDLRRSFGTRWAARVPAQQLQQLMRHRDISTTMTFYVGEMVTAIESAIYGTGAHLTNTSANSQV